MTIAPLRHTSSGWMPWYDLRVFGLTWILVGRRAEGERLLRAALEGMQIELGAPDRPPGSLDFQSAYLYASPGDEARALEQLRAWLEAGGLGTWDRLDLQRGWGRLFEHPEFREIMRVSEERLIEQRTVIADELRRIRNR